MSNQATFNRVAKRIIKQGRQAMGKGGMCMYRTPDGAMCAIGGEIKDSEYSPCLEGVSLGGSESASLTALKKICRDRRIPFEFAKALQGAHDRCQHTTGERFIREYKYNMRGVAVQFNLDPEVVSG